MNTSKKQKLYSLVLFCLGIGLGVASQNLPTLDSANINSLNSTFISKEIPKKCCSSFFIERDGYSLGYDARNRNPAWVYEHLSQENLKGEAERMSCAFKEDESLPEHLRATLMDYQGKGYDRGHLAPAADHKSCHNRLADTFYLTNMCPQCPQFNRGYWAAFEKHVRDLTKSYHDIEVITGPLYLPHTKSDGSRVVKYKVIGKNDVAVPTHFFKVIKCNSSSGLHEIKAYVLPNAQIAQNISLDTFAMSLEKVEKLAGMIFFP
ncbi:MAG: endonuclease G [Parachlamydia sp.]|nr:MAG: endonuclease G [Parachlamydia sp.]